MIKLKIGDNITFSATVISVDGNYKDLIEFYGKEAQARQAMEECAELIQAINKRLRYPDNDKALDGLYEEIADVEIMIDQLRIMFDLDEKKLDEWVKKKTKRVFDRLKNDKGLNVWPPQKVGEK